MSKDATIHLRIEFSPNGQNLNEKPVIRQKIVRWKENEKFKMGELFKLVDEKVHRELDNRMISYFSNTQKVNIYIGNYYKESQRWSSDIRDAKEINVEYNEIVGKAK